MEDWEQFFVEKSRRRAETVRRRGSFNSIRWISFGVFFFGLCVLLVLFLTT
jgi:hypothetical protein